MVVDGNRWRYSSLLTVLTVFAFILCARLGYLYVSDEHRFPINTVKISANFQHISRHQLETVLSTYENNNFFSLPINRLNKDLLALDWANEVSVQRIWPDVLSIKLVEKDPVAKWNNTLITASGKLFDVNQSVDNLGLVQLKGPDGQEKDVLQIYEKLSKLLSTFDLHVASLELHKNQSWDLSLTNGINLLLGKQDIEKRLARFCKAYHATFAAKAEQLVRVDLRYERGMAVQWDNKREDNGQKT